MPAALEHPAPPQELTAQPAGGWVAAAAATAGLAPRASSPSAHQPIGVFDSGIGGLSILRALRAQLPHERFAYFADNAHAPYGERSEAFVAERALAVAQTLVHTQRIKALVVACNTATAAAIAQVRAAHPQLVVVGVEPALKPAVAASQTKRIAVLATRGTLASAKFRSLHDSLAGQAEFVLQPCDGLAAAIEAADSGAIRALGGDYLRQSGPFGAHAGAVDTLVLGCTHYALASSLLAELAGPAVTLLEPGAPVARQLQRLLQQADLLHTDGPGGLAWEASGDAAAWSAVARQWLEAAPL